MVTNVSGIPGRILDVLVVNLVISIQLSINKTPLPELNIMIVLY